LYEDAASSARTPSVLCCMALKRMARLLTKVKKFVSATSCCCDALSTIKILYDTVNKEVEPFFKPSSTEDSFLRSLIAKWSRIIFYSSDMSEGIVLMNIENCLVKISNRIIHATVSEFPRAENWDAHFGFRKSSSNWSATTQLNAMKRKRKIVAFFIVEHSRQWNRRNSTCTTGSELAA